MTAPVLQNMFQDPTPSDGFAAKILTIGGGKGGIGKSFLAAGTGYALAQRGSRVLVVDLDLGGANLHAWLGTPPIRELDLGAYLRNETPDLDELVLPGPIPGLSMIHGAATHLGATNIKYAVKQKILAHLRRLNYDWIVVDLGAGTGYNTVDFFLLGTRGVLAMTPERTSIENAYRFLRASLLRSLRGISQHHGFQEELRWAEAHGQKTAHIETLIGNLASADPTAERVLRANLRHMRVSLVLNQVWDLDELKIANQMKLAVKRHLGLQLSFLGPVRFTEAVMRALRRADSPIEELFQQEGVREDVQGIVDRLLRDVEYTASALGSMA